ncbi:MAG: hypothetical protein OXC56_02135 [Chloroflexi bacterium]|nr:hypothetical protein [Chloroflexota bacterium]
MTPARGGTKKRSRRAGATASRRNGAQRAPGADTHPGFDAFGGSDRPALPALSAEEGVAAFLDALRAGDLWYPALLEVVARWVTPEETVGDATYRYLIGGEAFDWRRLAERLLDAAGDLVPADEAERLVFEGKPPAGEDPSEEAFARAIGREKYRAHLNFQYGVTVEEALLLQAEQDLQKARHLEGPRGEPADVAAYERVYSKTFAELTAEYRIETGASLGSNVSQAELAAFTYWCSKYRFRLAEPARVASDTRKALALLSRLEAARAPRERRVPSPEPAEIIEL